MSTVPISALPAASVNAVTDVFPIVQGSTTAKETLGGLRDWLRGELPWRTVETAKYTAVPTTSTRLAVSDTSRFLVGLPIRFALAGVEGYGYAIITAVSENAYVDVCGISLSATLTGLWIGLATQVALESFVVPGAYAASTQTVVRNVAKEVRSWWRTKGCLVRFMASHGTADTGGAQPRVNLMIKGAAVSSQNSGAGPALGTANTFVACEGGTLTAAACPVEFADALDIWVHAGTNANASDLTLVAVFVLA